MYTHALASIIVVVVAVVLCLHRLNEPWREKTNNANSDQV